MTVNQKITALRQEMQKQKLAAYIVPSSDPHQSEYVAAHWQSRAWLSGFTGSAGTLIVTIDHAGLWTDSRYFIQAEEELKGSEIVLHRQQVPHAPEHINWLVSHLPNLSDERSEGSKIGIDGSLFTVNQVRQMARAFQAKDLQIAGEFDLISTIWQDRPPLPKSPIYGHELKFAGRSRSEKIQIVQDELKKADVAYHLITTLDDVAWVLNLRGSDIEFNPLFVAFCIIGQEATYLFTDHEKINTSLKNKLNEAGVILKAYEQIHEHLSQLDGKIWYDRSGINIQLFNAIQDQHRFESFNICRKAKAIKTPHEVQHICNAMRKDGVALLRLFRWLEAELDKRSVSEYELAQQLASFRSQQEHYVGESFAAIAGYRGNGAIVHYRPKKEGSAMIKKEGILLLDSGGQYLDGTTDITRTVPLSEPTAEQKRNYTLVLKGHIALDQAIFPKGTTGVQLDTLARMYLWQDGLNYGHGTGHGVGYFLNVHEPPQGFATGPTTSRGTTALEPGMFSSNEPGFYKTNEYGIRIENLVICRKAKETDFGTFYKLEALTLFPIDKQLIDAQIMTVKEKQWLNTYHQKVWDELSPLLEKEEQAWLKTKCAPL